MQLLAETCERIGATTKKLEKTAIVAEYFRARELEDAAISAVFLSGRAFPAFEERTLQVGGSLLWKVVKEVTGASDDELECGISQDGRSGRGGVWLSVVEHPGLVQKKDEPGAPAQGKGEPFDKLRAGSGTPAEPSLAQQKGEAGHKLGHRHRP